MRDELEGIDEVDEKGVKNRQQVNWVYGRQGLNSDVGVGPKREGLEKMDDPNFEAGSCNAMQQHIHWKK